MPDDPLPLRALLGDAGAQVGLSAPVETGRVWSRWSDIVGPAVAAHARPTSLREGVLRIKTDSPSWATEVAYLADEIKKRSNEAAGRPLVESVHVWSGPFEASEMHAGPATRHEGDPRSATGPSRPRPTAPAEALERARAAWAEALARARSRPPREPRENPKNPW